jgi:hypothetical protein
LIVFDSVKKLFHLIKRKQSSLATTFLQAVIHLSTLNSNMNASAAQRIPKSFLFDSQYSILHGIASLFSPRLPHVFAHFPTGLKVNTSYERLSKK